MNLKNAIRGMRNPMNSWDKSDSYYDERGKYQIGENDRALAIRLKNAGGDHRKFLRQIFVSVDITAPLYWWKEFDTYKVGTVANSTSTMHKITEKAFSFSDFSHEHLSDDSIFLLKKIIDTLEKYRRAYNTETDGERASVLYNLLGNSTHIPSHKECWWQIIQLLPSSYNQLRTCTMNYENLINIYHARKHHKLDEWHTFCEWVETLPYAKELII